MLLKLVLVSILGVVASEHECYWNRQCSYQLFSTATPYDTVRGDIRDYPSPNNCEAISVWSLHRHGNRNPGEKIIDTIKELQMKLREEIVKSDAENTCSLCSQDIEEISNWKWNFTLDTSPSYLTQVGYDEIYSIGKRIRKKYRELLFGSSDQFYFRATDEQRTNASVRAFVQGLTEGTEKDLSSRIDETGATQNVIRPYENCDLYQQLVKNGPQLAEELASYDQSPEYLAVRDRVLKRLGITYQLSPADIFSIYELCRFDRSWSSKLQSPWCSLFSDEDLVVLEYRDDVRHYYKNGYGSLIIALSIAAAINVALDTLVTSLISQFRCRLSLLALSLRTLCEGLNVTNKGLLTQFSELIITDRLHRCVVRHQAVLEQVKMLQNCFSTPILAQFTVSIFIICVSAYQLAFENRNLVRISSMVFYLAAMMMQVFIYCNEGNQLVTDVISLFIYLYRDPITENLRNILSVVLLRKLFEKCALYKMMLSSNLNRLYKVNKLFSRKLGQS